MRFLTDAVAAAMALLPSVASGGPRSAWPSFQALPRPLYVAVPVVALVALAAAVWFWVFREPPMHVAAQWGLVGVWQLDCKAPVRPNNPSYKYSIENGQLLLTRDVGRGTTDTSKISDVTVAGEEISYVVHFAQAGDKNKETVARQNTLAKSPDGRIRTVINKDVRTGQVTVLDGLRTSDKKPTPWMSRCALQ